VAEPAERLRARLAAAALVVAAALEDGRAQAYVRYKTDDGKPFYWPDSCVAVTIYLNGFTQMRPNEVAKSVAAAAHTWSPDEVTCADMTSHPYFEIVPTLADSTAGAPPAAYDARNSLIFRTDNWTMSGTADGKAYSPAALAITSVFAKPDGHVVDADVEVNAVGQTWANLDPGADVGVGHGLEVHDLQNTLTHEFGHFIGLDHTCFTTSFDVVTRPRPVDDMGSPVPDCDTAPDSIRATVMFDSALPGETSKRVLSSDEVRAVCAIYPPDLDPKVCTMDSANDGIGCAAGRRPGGPLGHGGWAALSVAAAVAIAAARRRRRA
jgi:hypothetical protein